jgi:hypothetical protein
MGGSAFGCLGFVGFKFDEDRAFMCLLADEDCLHLVVVRIVRFAMVIVWTLCVFLALRLVISFFWMYG